MSICHRYATSLSYLLFSLYLAFSRSTDAYKRLLLGNSTHIIISILVLVKAHSLFPWCRTMCQTGHDDDHLTARLVGSGWWWWPAMMTQHHRQVMCQQRFASGSSHVSIGLLLGKPHSSGRKYNEIMRMMMHCCLTSRSSSFPTEQLAHCGCETG